MEITLDRYHEVTQIRYMLLTIPARSLVAALLLWIALPGAAAEYLIDTSGAHASINFKFDHLGIGRITGRFRDFKGTFSYDPEDVSASSVRVVVQTASLDSNHQTRDTNIRSAMFLDVEQFPTARFVSRAVIPGEGDELRIVGDLTLHGITREIELRGRKLGALTDQWGRERVGFEASTTLHTLDFDMRFPPGNRVLLEIYIEGVNKNPSKPS